MKYLFGILFFTLFLGCDDGDLITENFVFDTATLQKCSNSNILYKINGSESLVLNTPDTSFPNVSGSQSIAISGATSLAYRKYTATIAENTICNTPTVPLEDQWNVIGGSVEIVTNAVYATNNITIVAYNHNIKFKNVTFVTKEKQIVYDIYNFGDYRTEVVNLNFDFSAETTQKCSGNNLIFKYKDNKVLLLDVDPLLFENNATLPNTPRVRTIDINNKVVYRVFNGNLNTSFFCSAITPVNPILNEEWIAQNGVSGTSGEIRVETVQVGSSYVHTIKLYKTTFKKGILTYIFPTNDLFEFGTFTTS